MTSQWNPDPRRARPPSLARIMYVRALMLMLRFSLFVADEGVDERAAGMTGQGGALLGERCPDSLLPQLIPSQQIQPSFVQLTICFCWQERRDSNPQLPVLEAVVKRGKSKP